MPSTQLNQRVKRKEDFISKAESHNQLDDSEHHPFAKRICQRPDGGGGGGGVIQDSHDAFNKPHRAMAQEEMPSVMETESSYGAETVSVRNYVAENSDNPSQQLQLPSVGRADAAYSTSKCYCRPSWEIATDSSMSAFLFC